MISEMKKLVAILVICLCVALTAGFASGSPELQRIGANVAAKSKPAPGSGSTSMQFLNQTWATTVAKITGDGSPYVDGVGGVVCQVYQDPGTDCNFLLNIQTTSHPKRYVSYVFDDAADETTCGGGSAIGTIKDTGFVVVHHVGDATIGVPGARLASFYTNTDGYFKLSGRENCSFAVVVQRLSATTWYVSTDQTYGSPLYNFPGDLVPVGDIAERILYPSGDFAGNYHMPFGMTITCPGCK